MRQRSRPHTAKRQARCALRDKRVRPSGAAVRNTHAAVLGGNGRDADC